MSVHKQGRLTAPSLSPPQHTTSQLNRHNPDCDASLDLNRRHRSSLAQWVTLLTSQSRILYPVRHFLHTRTHPHTSSETIAQGWLVTGQQLMAGLGRIRVNVMDGFLDENMGHAPNLTSLCALYLFSYAPLTLEFYLPSFYRVHIEPLMIYVALVFTYSTECEKSSN